MHRYARVHKIPEAICPPTIQALANEDLALIPILHNHIHFTAKVAEKIAALRNDSPENVSTKAPHSEPLSPFATEIKLIRLGIEMGDTTEVRAIMPIFLTSLTSQEASAVIKDKSLLAPRNNLANENLATLRSAPDTDVKPEDIPLPASEGEDQVSDESPEFDVMSATMTRLVDLSCREIMTHLQGVQGDALMVKLQVAKPSLREKTSHRVWVERLAGKRDIAKRTEMADMLAKKLEVRLTSTHRVNIREHRRRALSSESQET